MTARSSWVWASMKPGATTSPVASMRACVSHAFQIAYLGDAIVPDSDVGAHALVSASVDQNAAFDEEIAG